MSKQERAVRRVFVSPLESIHQESQGESNTHLWRSCGNAGKELRKQLKELCAVVGNLLSLRHATVQQAEHCKVSTVRARYLAQQVGRHQAHEVMVGIEQTLQHQILDPYKHVSAH